MLQQAGKLVLEKTLRWKYPCEICELEGGFATNF